MSNTNNNTVKTVKTVEPTVETVDELTWKQGKAVVKWGASSNGLKLNLPEIKVSKADVASATKIVNGWKKPVADAIKGVAHWVCVARTLNSLGMTKKSAGMILDGKLKPETMLKRCGLPKEVLSLKFAPVAKESAFKPVAPVAPVAQPAAGMAFFAQETVAPTGDKAATILKLIAAGLTPAQAMAAVGM